MSEHDTSERARLTALEHEVGQLREALAARDNFIAVVAHELRNPMTPILAQVQRLQRLARGSSAPPTVTAAAERTEMLVLQYIKRATMLLDVTRMNAGRMRLSPEPHDYAETVRQVVDNLMLAARYSGSTLSHTLCERVPVVLDRLAGEQIAENLISNAIKYGDGKPIEVSLSAGDGAVVLTVTDQGKGISAEDQTRIFDRFERVIARGAKAGGFGIGLWVVRQLVDAMGGTIRVASAENAGSRFTVELPMNENEAA